MCFYEVINNQNNSEYNVTCNAKTVSKWLKAVHSLSGFLYNFANVATQTAVKVKDTVKETVEGKVRGLIRLLVIDCYYKL